MRLIDGDKLLKQFEVIGECEDCEHICEQDSNYCDYMKMRNLIKDAPTIDAEPVRHGHWIDKPTGRYGNWQSYCSACGKHNQIGGIDSNRHKPRCPWCGAYMDGVSE